MKTVILILIFIAGSVAIISLEYNWMLNRNLRHKELVIKGTPEIKNRITLALALLKEKAPEAYYMVNKYIGTIEQGKRTQMYPNEIPPRMSMYDKTAYYSLTWCAGSLAHEAFHSKLFHEYRIKHSTWFRFAVVPPGVADGFAAERKCIKFQLEVLKQIDAPLIEINHAARGDGTHIDVNGDGKVDMEDYRLRDW